MIMIAKVSMNMPAISKAMLRINNMTQGSLEMEVRS
jgi:hypothetical protein